MKSTIRLLQILKNTFMIHCRLKRVKYATCYIYLYVTQVLSQ